MSMFEGAHSRRRHAAIVLFGLLMATALLASTRSTPVADAVAGGEAPAAVRELLARGEDPNAAQGDGLTALHWAALRDDRELAEMLLYAGARLGAKTRNGAFTPLLIAARAGKSGMVELLLEAGADPDEATDTGASALMLAAAAGSPDTVTALLAAGADPNRAESTFGQTALIFAANANRSDSIAALIEGGADPAQTSVVLDAEAIEAQVREAAIQRGALLEAKAQIAKDAEERVAKALAEKEAAEAEKDADDETATEAGNEASSGQDDGTEEDEPEQGAEPSEDTPSPAETTGADPEAEGRATGDARRPIDAELGGNPPSAAAAASSARHSQAVTATGAAPAPEEVDAELSGNPPAPNDAAKPEESDEQKARRARGRGGRDDERKGPRPASMGQLVGKQGGMTPLLHAAREGHLEAARSLLESGADVNQVSDGDHTSPLLMATLNGHFDLAMFLLGRGADATLASDAGATPLYAAINVQWAPHAFYPQPSPAQEETTHLELMQALLDAGADPNARLEKKVWYTGYNFDQSGADETGATAFWRAAQSSDLAAMRLLVAAGADPTISSKVVPERRLPNGRNADVDLDADAPELGSPAMSPMQVATGAGWVGNFHRNAPGAMLAAVRYLVEELGADVNAADHHGYTPLHNAAARGDTEMILYLVFHGADVRAVARSGETVADMANGPVQRIQPFPETLALLEAMGSKNSGNCVSC